MTTKCWCGSSEADDRRMRMSDLAESVTNSPSRLSQRIDRLSRDGVVERGRCDVDARVLWVVLTDAGFQRLRDAASGHVEEVRRLFIDRLSADEIELLATLLPRLADSLGRRRLTRQSLRKRDELGVDSDHDAGDGGVRCTGNCGAPTGDAQMGLSRKIRNSRSVISV